MDERRLEQQLGEAQATIRALQQELAATNSGLVALTMELEQRVDDRTAELTAAHAELGKTNTELLQLTLELEDRVAERTAELAQANEALRAEIAVRELAEQELQAKNDEIRDMTRQLWQTAKLATMGELAASIAHELNNPLATVSLRVESLIARLSEDERSQKALAVIEQETGRMANLVSNLLEFSRRSSQQISSVDVREEIDNTLELIHYHLRKHNITVERHYAPETPLIHADRQQLRQLFLNLFTNAGDAMPQGGTLTIDLRRGKAASSVPNKEGQATAPAVVIEIADTGQGIAPEHLSRVTEPFFTTKPEGKGTGLGLAICKRIVQALHGTFDIKSEVSRGTAVRIVLPVVNGTNGKFLKET